MQLLTERIYAQPQHAGFRVLVDRVWPRGIKKIDAHLDLWAKTIAPSAELRKWFNHDPEKFTEFTQRYLAELSINPDWPAFRDTLQTQSQPIILLYGAKDEHNNQAVVLKDALTNAH